MTMNKKYFSKKVIDVDNLIDGAGDFNIDKMIVVLHQIARDAAEAQRGKCFGNCPFSNWMKRDERTLRKRKERA